MNTHHIHDEEIGFRSGTSDALSWMKKGLSKDGVRELLKKAEKGGNVNFSDADGNKFKLKHDEENGFSVHRRD